METRSVFLWILSVIICCQDVCRGQGFSFGDRSPSSTSLLGSLDPLTSFTSLDPFHQPEHPAKPNRAPPRQVQGSRLTVELLLVVDKTARDSWMPKDDGRLNLDQRTLVAIDTIKTFLKSVIHGVNTLYASLAEYGLYLDVTITDIKHVNDIWPQSGRPNKEMSTNDAIDSFYDWSWQTRRNLPAFDHAVLVTGSDLVDPRNTSRPTTGVAYKGVMCKFGSVSVVENTFTYQLVDTLAHELGHSLGCDHDGERNGCGAADGYIMSPRTEVNSTNRWHFSPCSAEAILEDLALLNRDDANCLHQTSVPPISSRHLGAIFDADQQCQLLFGDDAYFCRDFYSSADDYHHLCTSMWCSDNHNSSKCESHIASDGFVCGDRMMCIRGECVKDDAAPRVSDDCPQGDQPGIIHDNMTCADIVRTRPWSCYDDFFRRKCCLTCPSVKSGTPGCEYGDKEGWCNSDDMKYPYDCYLNNQTCCSSCDRLGNPARLGCEYGDHSTECATDLEIPLGCYWNEDMCCDTCVKYKNESNPDCSYGDRSTWCLEKLEVPHGCYLNGDLCCDTCQKARRPDNPACPYGDRYPDWCPTVTPFRCYNETIREWCCDSCGPHFNQSKTGCEYGDKFKNCQELIYPYACYHPTNEKACCELCSHYKTPEQKDCPYGDKQAWCWKLTLTYTYEQWCPLDKENDFCCGSCRFNETAVPVFGYRLMEEGLDKVTRLGQKFREEVRASIEEKRAEEKRKQEEEEAKQKTEESGPDLEVQEGKTEDSNLRPGDGDDASTNNVENKESIS